METEKEATVLVVDDEPKMVEMVRDYLEAVGFSVVSAENGKRAIEILKSGSGSESPDLVVLDVMMPGIDGLDTARQIRKDSDIPIIMLTAKAEEQDRLMGLEVGADDYVVKPFSMKELAARIRAVLRRTLRANNAGRTGQENVLKILDLELNRDRRTVSRTGRRIELTGAQFDLLSHMMQYPGRVFTRMQLLDALQDHAFEGYERTIDVHIKNIRKAIEPDPAHPGYLLTVWGVGYKMEDASADAAYSGRAGVPGDGTSADGDVSSGPRTSAGGDASSGPRASADGDASSGPRTSAGGDASSGPRASAGGDASSGPRASAGPRASSGGEKK